MYYEVLRSTMKYYEIPRSTMKYYEVKTMRLVNRVWNPKFG